jgi:iron complex outermembrane receptor protein/vitamin B12 transporter
MIRGRLVRFVCGLAVCATMASPSRAAQAQGSLEGTALDPLGAAVAGASVALLRGGAPVAGTTTDGAGGFAFHGLAADRYQVRVASPGFDTRTTEPVFVGGASAVTLAVDLQIGPLQQDVVVTASAAELPQSRTGAPVTVLDRATLEALHKPDVLEALRLVPGAQIVQTGQRGGGTSMFIRGGDSDFNKVLLDGIPVNDIGGAFDFSQVATTGLERLEVLRQANSVLYGSDALNGVVSLTTRRGRTRTPELTYAIDGGNLGTFHNTLSVGGAIDRVDYFSEVSHFDTDNHGPNHDFRNRTYAGRFGVALGGGTDLSGTIRRIGTDAGAPNAFGLYGLADDARQGGTRTYVTVAAESQLTARWQSAVRFGSVDETTRYINPAPTGEPFDPFGFGASYLGDTVTLAGADGATVTGRAILDFGGEYPSRFDSRTTRRLAFGQATYQVTPGLSISLGARFEREAAYDPDGDETAARNNAGVFAEGRATVLRRAYVSAGIAYERNEVFESAVTPRVSVAVYLRHPSSTAALGETKLVFNAGTGIKAPDVFQEQSSLFTLAQGTPVAAAASPIGPERSRNVDVGLEQGLAQGRVRLRVSYFDNDFRDLIEFVSSTVLPQLGIPPDVAAASGPGASVNSSSFRARGVETSVEAAAGSYVRLMGSYTFLDAEVSESFSGGALRPAINPAFPDTPIGAFSPLIGARPFRRPAHSGSLLVSYTQGHAQVALAGYFSGRSDDSTFLSDGFFGNSMLLPNRGLVAAYQKVDLSGSYQVHPRLRGYVSVENLLDQAYSAAFGYPSLPLTVRVGARITLGGD